MLPEWRVNQVARSRGGRIEFMSAPPAQGLPLVQELAAAQ
jgi:hypothetical protein